MSISFIYIVEALPFFSLHNDNYIFSPFSASCFIYLFIYSSSLLHFFFVSKAVHALKWSEIVGKTFFSSHTLHFYQDKYTQNKPRGKTILKNKEIN